MVKRIEKRQKYILDIIKYVISRVLVYIIISNLYFICNPFLFNNVIVYQFYRHNIAFLQ